MNHTRIHHEKPAIASSPRAWLEHFPPHRRSGASNLFHYSVRGGARTPTTVLDAVKAQVVRRLDWPDPLSPVHFRSVLEALQDDPGGALAYAAYVLEYEQLPREQCQQIKAEQSIHYLKEAMRGKDATPAQLSYLHALGYRGAPPEDRAAASALIDTLRQSRGCV